MIVQLHFRRFREKIASTRVRTHDLPIDHSTHPKSTSRWSYKFIFGEKKSFASVSIGAHDLLTRIFLPRHYQG